MKPGELLIQNVSKLNISNRENIRWIYISPHFDDAVLSCGGLIWEQTKKGIPVEIWTINTGDPPAGPVSDLITRVHTKWNTGTPGETVALRRTEDQIAARQVGATVQHLGMLDAIYRRTQAGLFKYTDDVFGPIHPEETGIIEETARRISLQLAETDILVCPLGLGGHVDHAIVRAAIESLERPILYYSDIPYLFKHPEELSAATSAMLPKHFFVSDPGLAAWQTGIEAYQSQLLSLFEDLQEMQTQIQDYHTSNNGLIIWEKT